MQNNQYLTLFPMPPFCCCRLSCVVLLPFFTSTSLPLTYPSSLTPPPGPALGGHLATILSTCLAISSKPDDVRAAAAEEAALRVAQVTDPLKSARLNRKLALLFMCQSLFTHPTARTQTK
jgi:hypothetical protein